MDVRKRRIRMAIGLVLSFLLASWLSSTLFLNHSPAIDTTFISRISFSLPTFNFISSTTTLPPPFPTDEPSVQIEPTQISYRNVQPTSTSFNPVPSSTPIITKIPTRIPTTHLPTPTLTSLPKAKTLCGQSPTSIPSWGDDAPYYEACIYDTDMNPVSMQQLCRAVCKSDNCTESICVTNGSYVKVNRGGSHSGYTDYGLKISLKDAAGRKRTIVEARAVSEVGRMSNCRTIEGICYTWDFITSGSRSVSIIVSK